VEVRVGYEHTAVSIDGVPVEQRPLAEAVEQ
jgi:hypothetical protein